MLVGVELQRLAAEDRLGSDVELGSREVDDEVARVEVLVVLRVDQHVRERRRGVADVGRLRGPVDDVADQPVDASSAGGPAWPC